MKKSELIDKMAWRAGVTKKVVSVALDALRQIAAEEIKAGRAFELHGIINLTVQTRAARTGRNPATGAPVDIPEKRVVRPRVPKSLAAMAG